jgi:anti-sigma regulatory factor (Ser/Thr protein kinase)
MEANAKSLNGGPPFSWSPGTDAEIRLPADVLAPATARVAVAGHVGERVPTRTSDDALLLVSELVTNSVRHSGATSDDELVLRIHVSPTAVRIELEDPGNGAMFGAAAPDLKRGGGFGLNLVHALCGRWGVQRGSIGVTRVWAELALPGAAAP